MSYFVIYRLHANYFSKQWLAKKGYEFRDAVDGRDGVKVYQQEGPFE